ncbi:MAG: methyl-accepting chemotaxis protein [Bacteroidota bacterium]
MNKSANAAYMVIERFTPLGTLFRDYTKVNKDILYIMSRVSAAQKTAGWEEAGWEDFEETLVDEYEEARNMFDSLLTVTHELDTTGLKPLILRMDSMNEVNTKRLRILADFEENEGYQANAYELFGQEVMNNGFKQSENFIMQMEMMGETIINFNTAYTQETAIAFTELKGVIISFLVAGILVTLIVSFMLIGSIIGPVWELRDKLVMLSKGKIPSPHKSRNHDEIGEMNEALTSLIEGMHALSQYAANIGAGRLDAHYELLSEDDEIGMSLVSMRENLQEAISEINVVVNKAGTLGDLDSRIDVDKKTGAWKELGSEVNNLLASIANPLSAVSEITSALSKGELKLVEGSSAKGAIGQLTQDLNLAINNLNLMVNNIVENADIVDITCQDMAAASNEMQISSGEMATAISEIGNGVSNQMTKIEEASDLISATLNASDAMSQKSKSIDIAANEGVQSSDKGKKLAKNMEQSMEEIFKYAQSTNDSIRVLMNRSKEISSVLGVITDISSQTNLLALNASIEAAQAGEFGRGFAVLAEEIRKLAEESKDSAEAIEKLVRDVQRDTEEAVSRIEIMDTVVAAGQKASNDSSKAFDDIFESTNRTLTYAEEILKSAHTQKEDVTSLAKLAEHIVIIAEESSVGTDEVTRSSSELSSGMKRYKTKSEELASVVSSLNGVVNQFQLLKRNRPDLND